jgi:hypothetical protein
MTALWFPSFDNHPCTKLIHIEIFQVTELFLAFLVVDFEATFTFFSVDII